MKKTKLRFLLTFLILGLVVIIIYSLRPVPTPDEKDSLTVSGIVSDIYEGGVHDVVFRLKGNPKMYYVNRGLERGLRLDDLRTALLQQEITIKYPDYWSPLDPRQSSIHISKIESGQTTIFSELKNN